MKEGKVPNFVQHIIERTQPDGIEGLSNDEQADEQSPQIEPKKRRGRFRIYSDEERKQRHVEATKQWRKDNPDKRKELDRRHYARHRDEGIEYSRSYREKNPLKGTDKRKEQSKRSYMKNKDKINERRRQKRKEQRETGLQQEKTQDIQVFPHPTKK
jgi:hypothetical protein